MAATERVVVLMPPAKKAVLDDRAASAGAISTGEFIRRAVDAYGEPALAEAEELRGLRALLAVIRAETLRQLDLDERNLDDMLSCRANAGRLGS